MVIEPLLKGMFVLDDGIPIPFAYNPEEIDEDRSVTYGEKHPLGMSHPRYHYTYGNGRTQSWSMSASNRLRVAGIKVPFPLEVYIETLYDLTYPVWKAGEMSAPPVVLFLFGGFVRRLKIKSIKVTGKKYSSVLLLEHVDIQITTFEVLVKGKERLNVSAKLGF